MPNNNINNNLLWESIENQQIASHQVAQQINAAEVKSAKKAGEYSKTKDIVLPAEKEKKGDKAKAASGKPKLSPPTRKWDGAKEDNNIGIIAIIAAVLVAQSKASSNFWSNLWQQSGKSMLMQVKFAPIIADAVKNAADQEAKATKSDADMYQKDGIINLTFFGLAVAGGIGAAAIAPAGEGAAAGGEDAVPEATPAATATDESVTDPVETPEETAEKSASKASEKTGDDEAQVDKEVDKDKEKFLDRMKRYGKTTANKFTKSNMNTWLTKTMGIGQMFSMAAQGSTGIVNSQALTKKARHQTKSGTYNAYAKQDEQYAQFYGQAYNRENQVSQSGQQAIDYAMNVLKSASDSLTQVTNSMFQV